jgi:hypothetical protein
MSILRNWNRWSRAGFLSVVAMALASACSSSNDVPGLGTSPGTDGGPSGNACATPNTGCPCSTDGMQTACGEVISQEGSYVTCSEGTRTCTAGAWGTCNGTTIAIKSTESISGSDGSIHIQTLGGTAQTDAGTCSPCDLSCMGFVDNSTGVDAGPNLIPTDAGGWTLPLELTEAGPCSGLQCSIPTCSAGQTTTITGTVYDPAAINPVYNAIVMIPNGTVSPIPAGVSNSACGGAPLPPAVTPTTYAYTGTDGTFTLTNVPVGTAVPLVIQLGRWRRQVNINTSTLTCGHSLNISSNCAGLNHYSTTAACLTRLPRLQSEGNIPLTAIGTGNLDAIECMLYRMGVSSTMFTDEYSSTGRIHIFDDGGATLASPNANDDLSYLLGFSCPTGQCPAGSYSTTGIANPGFDSNNLNSWTKSGSYGQSTNAWSTTGNYSAVLGSGNSVGSCVYSNSNTLTQAGLVAPANASTINVDEYELCRGNNNYSRVAVTDTTAGGTQTCQDCNYNNSETCTLPVTPGHSYTLVLTNNDQNNSGYCTETFFDNVAWGITPPVASLLNNYDLVMLPCDGGGEYGSVNWGQSYDDPGRTNLVNYANNGGRVFTSHWGREWIERTSAAIVNGPFPGVANWVDDTQIGSGNAATGVINAGAAWGASFNTWMTNVGAASGGTFTINPNRIDVSSVTAASELYVYYQSNNYPANFVFNTPIGSGSPVGRVMYTDMHLANGTPSGTFPSNCPTQGSALLAQEDAAEYLLFDLAGCVSGTPIPGPSMQYYPATFSRDFLATCPAGQEPVWQNFYWSDSTPGNSSVVFTASTADTQAQLATQYPVVPVATANGANVCPGGPSCSTFPITTSTNPGVPIDAALLAGGSPGGGSPAVASHAWLRVSMTLNPTSNAQTAPTLLGWQQNYGCIDAE